MAEWMQPKNEFIMWKIRYSLKTSGKDNKMKRM